MKYIVLLSLFLLLTSCFSDKTNSQQDISQVPTNNNIQDDSNIEKDTVEKVVEEKLEPITELDNNKLLVKSEGIKFVFTEKFINSDGENLQSLSDTGRFFAILFGPQYEEKTPDGETIDVLAYSLKSTEKRDFELTKSSLLENGKDVYLSLPTLETIGDYEVVTWVKKGFCEDRGFEILGDSMNFIIESGGCSTTLEQDKTYIINFIKSIEKI